MSCKAQLLPPISESITVHPLNNCCNNIITPKNLIIKMRNINNSIIRGKIFCESTDGLPVAGAIVVASATINGSLSYYVGISNDNGEYSICVPAPSEGAENIIYSIQAYRCCCANTPTEADCTCN